MNATDVIERFLERYNARDWDALADCFSAAGFQRTGPYGDTIEGAAEYVAFLRRVVPTLGDRYRLDPVRVVPAGRGALAEVVEDFEVDGEVRRTPEAIVVEVDADGRIARMRLYVQRPRDLPPAGGRAAMGQRD